MLVNRLALVLFRLPSSKATLSTAPRAATDLSCQPTRTKWYSPAATGRPSTIISEPGLLWEKSGDALTELGTDQEGIIFAIWRVPWCPRYRTAS